MKTELDTIMAEKKLDAIFVFGNAENNPPMTYLTGGGHVTAATLIKKRGAEAVLFCNGMERDEAAKSNLKVRLYDEFPINELLKDANGDLNLISAIRLGKIIQQMEIKGRIGIYGNSDISGLYLTLTHLKKLNPGLELVGESRENSLFMMAMETKENDEVERIKKIGKTTTEVVQLTRDFLTSRHVNQSGVLLNDDGSQLLLGQVKGKINLWLAERNAVPSEGFIFSIGRDAGIPHSQGNANDLMMLGKTIVFDIYPQETGGGYFYDFTRTWCLGYASDEAQNLYDQVLNGYNLIIKNLSINTPFKKYQEMICRHFESLGHYTPLSSNSSLEGYIHSLGHGVGLNIHERPWSGLTSSDDNILKPGSIITIEPGLYYPEKGMGFRIEDTYCVNANGKFEKLADYPYDFVLPMNYSN